MFFALRQRRSAGVPVTAAVHRLIGLGNAARDRRDWASAADAYGAALAANPALHHIWVQYGHMLKESGRPDAAAEAYDQAFTLLPHDPEPLNHAAHMRKAQGDTRAAAKYFLRALRAGDGNAETLQGLRELILPIARVDAAALYRAAHHAQDTTAGGWQAAAAAVVGAIDRILGMSVDIATSEGAALRSARELLDRISAEQVLSSPEGRRGVVFDLSDLISHFRHSRLPTGIQRVQLEVVARAMWDPRLDVRLCCFVDSRDALIDIPPILFAELAAMSTAGSDHQAADWQLLVARLFIHLLLAEPFEFRPNETLVNMGTSWWIYNYFLLIRNAKRDFDITYIPFVHDLIPIMASDHCVTGLVEDYVHWLVGAFDHADFFLVNSQSTGNDLVRAAERLGHHIDPGVIEVVTLDADFRRPAPRLAPDALSRWHLAGKDYCLFVSTIESRKNHVLALDAWARLIEAHGADSVPTLVCVGRMGWLNDGFHERLARNPILRRLVLVIPRASDEELALLYRSCSFTLYPSHYEGWGLPITESLCYGRVPVVADNSSLPEAGGKFAVYFQSNSASDLVAALERVIFEPGYREQMEQGIAAGFRPRSWAEIANQITDAVVRAELSTKSDKVPCIVPGQYYPVSLHKGTRIWRGLGSGEMFRAGRGWLWPEVFGCRTAPEGGELLFRVMNTRGAMRLYLRLRGLDGVGTAFLISTAGHRIASGNLECGEERWVVGDIPMIGDDGLVSIHVRGGSAETIELATGGSRRQAPVSVSVIGFAVQERADEIGRLVFVEKTALGELNSINPYAEPTYREKTMTAA